MAMPGLTATIDHAAEARYRERRAAADRQHRPELRLPPSPPPADDSGDGFDAAYYGRRFKSRPLAVSRRSTGPRRRRRAPDPAEDSALIDFFGHLSLLLVAVRAGDIGRAQAAADALALDALVELSAGMGAGGLRGAARRPRRPSRDADPTRRRRRPRRRACARRRPPRRDAPTRRRPTPMPTTSTTAKRPTIRWRTTARAIPAPSEPSGLFRAARKRAIAPRRGT